MIRYKRLNESFDQSEVSTMQLMRTIENSQNGKDLKEIVYLKEIEHLVQKALDLVYRGCEEVGVRAIPDAKWRVGRSRFNYRPQDPMFFCEYSLELRLVDFDEDSSFSKNAVMNIEDGLMKIESGVFPNSECAWLIEFSGGRRFLRVLDNWKTLTVKFRFFNENAFIAPEIYPHAMRR